MSHSTDQKTSAPKIIAVTSGKGGVGKTSVTVNTGIALSQKGYKVCLFDADSNLANINILLGVAPEFTLQHVLSGEKDIREILLQKCGLYIVPGASGIADFVGLQLHAQQRLIQALETLEKDFDYLFVDTSSGIDSTVLSFVESANQSIVVITPEPTSLTDAFSLLRVLKKRGHEKKVNIVVNSVSTEQRAQKIYSRFADAVEKYLNYRPDFLGSVLKDELLSSAVCLQNPIIQYKPTSPSSNGFYRLADAIDKRADFATNQTLSSQWKLHSPEKGNPDFSLKNATAEINEHQAAVVEVPVLTLEDHRQAILAAIKNSNISKHELMSIMAEFTEAYVSRFNAYPVDAAKMLYHSLELNSIPMDQVNDLMSILQLTYESNFDYADKESATRYLCSLVNNFVEKYKEYPFDAISTLYQSLDLLPLSEVKMRKLLTTLHLIYQDRYLSADKKQADDQPLLCCAEDDNSELEKLTALIQQRHLVNLEQKIKQEFGVREEREEIISKAKSSAIQKNTTETGIEQPLVDASDDYDSLMDSIRYASLLE